MINGDVRWEESMVSVKSSVLDPSAHSRVQELATELFDLVVDGPEGDTIYAAFQDQGAEEDFDEGEMEDFFG